MRRKVTIKKKKIKEIGSYAGQLFSVFQDTTKAFMLKRRTQFVFKTLSGIEVEDIPLKLLTNSRLPPMFSFFGLPNMEMGFRMRPSDKKVWTAPLEEMLEKRKRESYASKNVRGLHRAKNPASNLQVRQEEGNR